MTKAELTQLEEIKYYSNQLLKTKSDKRKRDISRKLMKLMKELREYRGYMYGG